MPCRSAFLLRFGLRWREHVNGIASTFIAVRFLVGFLGGFLVRFLVRTVSVAPFQLVGYRTRQLR
jgi:hypothetical protein